MDNAGETRSDARMASEGPRATGTLRPGGLSYGMHRDQEVSPTDVFYVSVHAVDSVWTHHSPALQRQALQAEPADDATSKR